MGPGGANALSTTDTPEPLARWSSGIVIVRPGHVSGARVRVRMFKNLWSSITCRAMMRGARPVAEPPGACRPDVWHEMQRRDHARPRPLGRLGSGRLPAFHLPPINPVVSRGAYLSRVGMLVLGCDSRLDAFSGSHFRTWLPSGAGCPTTGPPAVRPARSSRTRASSPQHPNACGG